MSEQTPWMVTCQKHGDVFLTEEEYRRQMNRGSYQWRCPIQEVDPDIGPGICGRIAIWNDGNFVTHKPLSGIVLAEAACRACGLEWPTAIGSCQDCSKDILEPHTNLAHALLLWGLVAERMWEADYRLSQNGKMFDVEYLLDVSQEQMFETYGIGPEAICRAIVGVLTEKEST